jgi:anti-sigma B factor antagonist
VWFERSSRGGLPRSWPAELRGSTCGDGLALHIHGDVSRPIGDLDLGTVTEFQAALLGFAGRGQRVVALDLSGLSFVDETGLAAIISFERQLRDEERVLVLRRPSPMMKRVLDVNGLSWLLEVQSRAQSHIEAAAPEDEFGTERSPYVFEEERQCS